MNRKQKSYSPGIFREILNRNCKSPQPLKGALKKYTQEQGFPVHFTKFLEDHFILNDVWLGGVEVFGEYSLLSSLKDEECGLHLLKLGYLQFASCGNGDFVVVNIKDKYGNGFGEVGYICHEECAPGNDFANLSKWLRIVAPSMEEFGIGHENEKLGNDYFDYCEN
jgi:hypothetical protein